MKDKKKIGLALSGGAAKGLTHIGVIQELEALGVDIAAIAGTSMGAIIGGWYAATKDIESIADIAREKEWGFSWKDISPRTGALFNIQKLERFFKKHLGNIRIEDLKIPFAAVATDIISGKEIHLKKGSLVNSILASSAVPEIFPPVKSGALILIDGGLVNPLPFDVARDLGADIVIGVDLFIDATLKTPNHIANGEWKPWHFFTILYDSLEIMQEQLAKVHMQKHDIMLTPRVGHLRNTDFNKADEAMRAGREEVRTMRKAILQAADLPPRAETWGEKLVDFLNQ